jgi:hypothetical protein
MAGALPIFLCTFICYDQWIKSAGWPTGLPIAPLAVLFTHLVWVYVHTWSARKDPLRNPRGIQADQRGQHVRRRPLTKGQLYVARPLLWGENTARDNALALSATRAHNHWGYHAFRTLGRFVRLSKGCPKVLTGNSHVCGNTVYVQGNTYASSSPPRTPLLLRGWAYIRTQPT